jgi:DNA-binding LacI/PurR family transcriptional regulator
MNKPRPEPLRVGLKDIAREAGLAHATVSMALRNSPKISMATRLRVQALARKMDYVPNPMAAGLAQFKQNSKIKPVHSAFAWLNFWPEPEKLRNYQEFDLYWQGAAACAKQHGYRLDEFRVNEQMPFDRIEKILHARNVQGILIPPGSLPDDWETFHWERFAVVRLSRPGRRLFAHSVTSDQMENTLTAFDVARKSGYERIGFVGSRWRTRFFGAGFLWGQAGLPLRLRLPPLFFLNPEECARNLKALDSWIRKTRPDAILTEFPNLKELLGKCGRRVPEDIGVAALNVLDCPINAGIHQNPEEVGRVAVLALISQVNDNAHGVPAIHREILIRGKWVDGPDLPTQRQAGSQTRA